MGETSNLVLFCVIWLLTCEPRACAFSYTANLLSCFMDAFCKWFSWLVFAFCRASQFIITCVFLLRNAPIVLVQLGCCCFVLLVRKEGSESWLT